MPAAKPARVLGALVALASAFVAAPASADRLVPKKGPAVRGTVIRTDTEAIVNRFRSRTAAMTYGVVRFPLDQVKRIEEEENAEETVRRKAEELKPDDADGRVGLAKYAIGQKVKPEATRLLEEALALKPDHAEALALYGDRARFAAAKRGNPALDPDLRRDLVAYLAMEDGSARAKEARRLEAERGFLARPEVLERAWRSSRAPKGLREDVALTLRSDKHPGGVYTISVPDTYDPLVPCPLLFALHGGGRGGKEGDQVVGSGRDAASLYVGGIARVGWILVCPTALAAPWSAGPNEGFLLSVLEEVQARYNVDLDRVYLTGHSMGGFGTWWFGPRHTDLFAGIGPTAGGGPGGFKELKEARTAIFSYHSADDPVCSVAPIQPAMETLLKMDADLVYLQLEDRGHSFPPEAEQELFDVFRVKRLYDARRQSAWPRSSFSRKATSDETKYLGDLASAWGTASGAGSAAGKPDLKDLVSELERGGGNAERAAASLAATKPEGAGKAVSKVLRSSKVSDDARAYAARALGDLGDPAGVEALAEAVLVEKPARLVRESAVALRKLAQPAAADALGKAMAAWAASYDRRLVGGKIDYPDWEELCHTLAELVEAWAVCAPPLGAAAAIERHAVRRVLEARNPVDALARAGQDASRPRGRLAEAVGRAYATLSAPETFSRALEAAVAGDESAVEAAKKGAGSPHVRPVPPAK
jgi:poly(3-hydroxybutyrate) depolymerase